MLDRSRTLMTSFREAMDSPGTSRYRPGCLAYSMEEEGDRSRAPRRSFPLSSAGAPVTKRTPSRGKRVSRTWNSGRRFA